jgi:peptide deformylase
MPKLEIKVYPDKILRKKAIPVKHIDDKERSFVSNMIETMHEAKGIGLAAPQVGVSKRIIVIEDVENKNNGSPLALFNPKIVKKKGKSSFCEGCLSVPQVTADIVRSERVLVEALNIEGERVRIDAKGLFATVLQHEIDHLDGILFIDRVGFFKRKKILKEISSKVCVEL